VSADESRSVGMLGDSMVEKGEKLAGKKEIRQDDKHGIVLDIEGAEETTGEAVVGEEEDLEGEMRTFGEEDIYFYGEVGEWKSERLKDLRVRDVARSELWKWDQKVLEARATSNQPDELAGSKAKGQEGDRNRDRWQEVLVSHDEKEARDEAEREKAGQCWEEEKLTNTGYEEISGEIVDKEISFVEGLWYNLKSGVGFTDIDGRTLGAVCGRFYHLQGGNTLWGAQCLNLQLGCAVCGIGEVVETKRKDVGQVAWEESYMSEVASFFEMTAGACLAEGEVGKKIECEKGVDDPLDAIYGGCAGYPTSRRPFEYRRELDHTTSILAMET